MMLGAARRPTGPRHSILQDGTIQAMSTGMKLGSLIDEETASAGTTRSSRGGGGGGFRDALQSSGAKTVAGIVVLLIVIFAGVRVMGVVRSSAPQRAGVAYVHVDTGETRFIPVGRPAPEGFHPAEYCFRNTCGPDGGTAVILNSYLGKEGQTYCPKCGAEVVAHNPRPEGYETTTPADWER